jgi:hypothetical protein
MWMHFRSAQFNGHTFSRSISYRKTRRYGRIASSACQNIFIFGFLICAAVAGILPQSFVSAQSEQPVAQIADKELQVGGIGAPGFLPVKLSLDWSVTQPQVIHAIIVFHGKSRDADGYFNSVVDALRGAGDPFPSSTIIIAPQFLNEEDVTAHRLQPQILRWRRGTWESGSLSTSPIAVSSYEIIDTIIRRLANRTTFPNLATITLAGHSGGGQAVQRYAVLGSGEASSGKSIHIRYVIANPSSYFYFTEERPISITFPFSYAVPVRTCERFDHWRYGPVDPPSYIKNRLSKPWSALEYDYAKRDITYLLGTADTDPKQEDLDQSCAGELQGDNRLIRGEAFYQLLHERHKSTEWQQRLWFATGAGHVARQMFTSRCGVAALIGSEICEDREN